MCMLVYIAAEKPLELVAWDETKPAFHVSEIKETEFSVRAQFAKSHIYYAGSHEGCGCGFQLGEYPEYEDEEKDLKRVTLAAFSEYLAKQLANVKEIELYACWDGDQAAAPEFFRHFTPDTLRSEDFYFLEKEHSQIANEAA